jgi:hypothetical protein
MPVTRDMVYSWITGWKRSKKTKTLDDWIRAKVDELALEDSMVNTSGHDNLPDETSVADMIIMDLDSYSNAPSS